MLTTVLRKAKRVCRACFDISVLLDLAALDHDVARALDLDLRPLQRDVPVAFHHELGAARLDRDLLGRDELDLLGVQSVSLRDVGLVLAPDPASLVLLYADALVLRDRDLLVATDGETPILADPDRLLPRDSPIAVLLDREALLPCYGLGMVASDLD